MGIFTLIDQNASIIFAKYMSVRCILKTLNTFKFKTTWPHKSIDVTIVIKINKWEGNWIYAVERKNYFTFAGT